jgi:hypothetical protein
MIRFSAMGMIRRRVTWTAGLLEPLRDEAVYRLQQEHPDVGYEQESDE